MAQTTAQGRIIFLLFFGVLIAALDIAIVGPVMPAIQAAYDLDERSMAWIFNAFVLSNLVAVPIMTKLSDTFGRRIMYIIDIGLFGAGALIVGLSDSFGVLLVGRVFQGLAAGGIFPVASAVVGESFPVEKQGRSLGIIGAVFGLAFIIGPIMAGIMLNYDWRMLFWFTPIIVLPLMILGWIWLPPNGVKTASQRRIDWLGLGLMTVSVGSLAYGITFIDITDVWAGEYEMRALAGLGLSLLAFPMFIYRQLHTKAPVIRLGLFRRRQVVLAIIISAGTGLAEAAFVFFPKLTAAAFLVDRSTASYMLLPLMATVAIGSPIAGRLVDKVGARFVVILGTFSLAVGLMLMAGWSDVLWGYYSGSILIGFGITSLLGSALNYILLTESLAEERTVAQGMITLSLNFGQLIGGATIGSIAASAGGTVAGYMNAFSSIAIVAVVLVVLSFAIRKK